MKPRLIIRLDRNKLHCVYSDEINEVVIIDEKNDVSVMETAGLNLLDPRKVGHISTQVEIIKRNHESK